MSIPRLLCVLVCACAVLGGCKSTDKSPLAVDRTRSSKGLEIPPDLVTNSSIPSASATAAAEAEGSRVLPAASKGIHSEIKTDGDRRWLEVDADAEVVWKRLLEYWSSLGVALVVNRPVDGIMETNWISTTFTTDKPGVANLLNLFSVDKPFHKYRIRLERAGDNKTNLYAAHRTSTKTEIFYPRRDVEYEWVEKTGDVERQIEVLQALAYAFDPSSLVNPPG